MIALAFKLPVEGDDVVAEPALFADDCCDTCGRVFGAAELAAFRDEACDEDAMPGTCEECAEREMAHGAAVEDAKHLPSCVRFSGYRGVEDDCSCGMP